MASTVTYHLADFDGPLDLLLHLIKTSEVDIFDIPIVLITQQYLAFLQAEQERNLDIAGEFLVMAATLMSIKATYLIPKNDNVDLDEDLADYVDEPDPRVDLVNQLLEYQKYQQAAAKLREREEERQLQFSRLPMSPPADIEKAPLPAGIALSDLQTAFAKMIRRRQLTEPAARTMVAEQWSLQVQMGDIMQKVRERGRMTFADFFDPQDNREKMVTTFLGMLELVRHQCLLIEQADAFGTINVQSGPRPYETIDFSEDKNENG